MVQKAVEMGAGVLQPVMTQHCQAPRIKLDRMRANAVEAAEQCGILSVADCREMVRLPQLLQGWDTGRQLIFCDERADEAAVLDILSPLAGRPLALLIGPEGGFSADERSMLRQAPFVTAIPLARASCAPMQRPWRRWPWCRRRPATGGHDALALRSVLASGPVRAIDSLSNHRPPAADSGLESHGARHDRFDADRQRR